MKIEMLFGKPLKTVNSDVHMYMLAAQADCCFSDPAGPFECTSGRSASDDLEALREDLLRLESGWIPSCSDLASAPEFQNWGILDAGESLPRVVGYIAGASADLGNVEGKKRMVTHQVLARDRELNWIRDRSGFYRLDAAEPEPRLVVPSQRRRRSTNSFKHSRSGRISF